MSAAPSSAATRRWRAPERLSVSGQLGVHVRGPGDPTHRLRADDCWRCARTPDGPVTLRLSQHGVEVSAEAWGSGRGWALDQLPELLGGTDDVTGFDPRGHPMLIEAVRRYGVPRVGASRLVWEALLPAILEQKVTGQEAYRGFRRLVARYGEPAPGPDHGLLLPPSAEDARVIPSWEWLRFPVSPDRSRTVLTAARAAPALERTWGHTGDEVERRLISLPGIGSWTAAEVRARAHGDADAVSFGDYHVARDVGWALTGQEWDDDRLREFLEPFAPHRGRVVQLIYRIAGHRPRRGPRMAPRRHLPG